MKIWLPFLVATSGVFLGNGVLAQARDVGDPTGLSLHEDAERAEETRPGSHKLLRAGASNGGEATEISSANPTFDGLKDRMHGLSMHVDSLVLAVAAGDDVQEWQMEELTRELQHVQTGLTLDHLAVSQATFEEKITMVKEMAGSYAVLAQLVTVLGAAPATTTNGTAADSAAAPSKAAVRSMLNELKLSLGAADSLTNDFLGVLGSLSDPQDDSSSEDDPDAVSDVPSALLESHRLLAKNQTGGVVQANSSGSVAFEADSDAGSNGQFNEYDRMQQDQQHWHGFKSGQEYRAWRKKHTQASPHSNHLFDIHEHLLTGKYVAVHEKILGMGDRTHDKHYGRRRLQSSATKLEQCDLLSKCARGMSLYDLIFYHFSDYIDTKTGIFGQNFRIPADFNIVQLETSIIASIKAIDSAADEAEKLGACDDLLGHMHREEATKDPHYWNWRAGVVSEVCYASGTTKKIDLFLIKTHLGMKVAERIFKEAVYAANTLHKYRNKQQNPDEPFIFMGKNGVRYPNRIMGYKQDDETGRPILPVKVEDFYELKDTGVAKISEVKFHNEQCPSGWMHGGFDMTNNLLLCQRSWAGDCEEDCAREKCAEAGGVWAGLDPCCNPYQCNFEQADVIILEDELINATMRVFGGISFGQLSALAEVGKEEFKLADKKCPDIPPAMPGQAPPRPWAYEGIEGNRLVCGRGWRPECGEGCAFELCHEAGGTWTFEDNGRTGAFTCAFGKDCPPNYMADGTGPNGGPRCVAAATAAMGSASVAANVCRNHGGTWAGLDPCCNPFTCYMPDTYTIDKQPTPPGYCCLDSADESGTWGEPYHCSQTCQNFAPSFAGIGQGSCDTFGGTWCQAPQDCSPLKRCIAKYLEDAETEGTSTYNPAFATYLKDAPEIKDHTSGEECGKVREYFGYEKTFPIDLKICDEVGEFRNSGDMDFLNEVFEEMAAAATDPPLTLTSTDGSKTPLDTTTVEIVPHEITSATKKPVKSAEPASSKCNGAAYYTTVTVLFGLQRLVDTLDSIFATVTAFDCPADCFGITDSVCAGSITILRVIALIAYFFAKLVHALADFSLNDMVCGGVDDVTAETATLQTTAVYENLNTIYDVLEQRQLQTHASLDHINLQLPKIGKSLNSINEQHTTIDQKLNDVDKKLDDVLALKGDKNEATLSHIVHVVESTKAKILEDIGAKCTNGAGARRLLELSSSEQDGGTTETDHTSINTDDLAKLKEELEKTMEEQEKRTEKMMEKTMATTMEEQEKRTEKMEKAMETTMAKLMEVEKMIQTLLVSVTKEG